MRLTSVVILLQALAFRALAAAVPSDTPEATPDGAETQDPEVWDAIIVGGGPSGLAALSGLARVRRRVLLIDSGEYRNGPTRHMHDVLGFDGVTPAYYRWAAREQISHYKTVSMTNGTVTKIEPQQNNTSFTVSATYPGDEEKTLYARKIVIGTGLRDILPDTPGVEENWGKGLYWCPWCDGHEHADQELGLLASLDKIPGMLHEILTLNDKGLVAFVNGTDTPEARAQTTDEEDPDWELYLKLHNVRIENGTIAQIERLANGTAGDEDPSLPTVPEHDRFVVDFEPGQGEPVECDAFFTSFPNEQRSSVPAEMGLELEENKIFADSERGSVTSIPGVYAVGDANSDGSTNVPHALYSGKKAAVYLHVQIAREEEAAEIEKAKEEGLAERSDEAVNFDEVARSLWSRVNGEPRDLLYAGEFDQ